jgi:CelD/BcsL family acetyltransferase involved in cellulose biosynthesis
MGVLAPDEVPEGMSALFRLHTLRWRQRWLPGVLAGAHRQNFHQDVARGFSLKNWLRLYAIRLDHEIQAVLYCFSYQGKGYYYLGGFEPALSKYSLGTVLTAYAIHDSIEAGLNEFDFLRGNEPYKARWTRNHRMNYRLLLRKSTLRSDLATGMVHGERRIEHAFKEALHQRFGRG